jgi:heat shock protein HslJ
MKQILTIAMLFLLLASCAKKPLQETKETTVKDSTIVKTETRIDTITMPGDTIEFEVKINCDSVTNEPEPVSYQDENEQSSVSLSIDSTGTLKGQAGCDSLRKELELKDQKITRLRTEKTLHTKPVRVQWVAWYHKAAMWLAGGYLLLTVIVMLMKVFIGSIQPF